jgi:enoyl-CoA hydratase
MDSKTIPEYLRGGPKVPAEYKSIIYEPGPVTRLIFNRPRYKNAISHPMYAEIEHAFERAAADSECKVLVVSGAGDHFGSGHDVLGGSPEGAPMLDDGVPPAELRKRYPNEKEMWRAYWVQHTWYAWQMHMDVLYAFPKPTIAMVHGYCIFGQALIAEMMDLIFSTEDALFLGLGGREGWDMSPRKTLEVAYEHRFVTGKEAHALGMVNRVFADYATLERETLAYAARVAENPSYQLRNIKHGFHQRMEITGFPKYIWEGWKETAYNMLYQRPGVVNRASYEAEDLSERHRQRYEGKGQARAGRALSNLKYKLESEGQPVPQIVLDALARDQARDPKAFWEKALHQDWRDAENVAKAEMEAKAYAEFQEQEKAKANAAQA